LLLGLDAWVGLGKGVKFGILHADWLLLAALVLCGMGEPLRAEVKGPCIFYHGCWG
jgi:hypothetical protein